MKITIINGSPKLGESTSGYLVNCLVKRLGEQEIRIININRGAFTQLDEAFLKESDALVFAFPLYVDSIPSHLLRLMVQLETVQYKANAHVYCIINNGFFEGKQNRFVIQQMKLWSEKAKLTWGQAVGVGAGEMITIIKMIPMGVGPNMSLGRRLKELARNILARKSGDDHLINLNWFNFLYRSESARFTWYPRAKKNGLTKEQMFRKLNGE